MLQLLSELKQRSYHCTQLLSYLSAAANQVHFLHSSPCSYGNFSDKRGLRVIDIEESRRNRRLWSACSFNCQCSRLRSVNWWQEDSATDPHWGRLLVIPPTDGPITTCQPSTSHYTRRLSSPLSTRFATPLLSENNNASFRDYFSR
jgi:hypothetical protein